MDAKITHNKKNNLWILKIQEIDLDNHKTDYKTYCYTSREEAETVLKEKECIFRKNRALAPHERSAVPLGTDHCPVC